MKKKNHLLAGAFALAIAGLGVSVTAARADTLAYNSTPTDGWFYGAGNDYVPANTEVLTTLAGDQLYLRLHETFVLAPASVGNIYSFSTAAGKQISYDWGFDSSGVFEGTAVLTFTNAAGGSFSYNALAAGNDNKTGLGSTQNSYRLNPLPGLNFNPLVNDSYNVNLTVTGLAGGIKSLNAVAKLGTGFAGGAVPEPASWALMISGFGLTGAALRRRRAAVAA